MRKWQSRTRAMSHGQKPRWPDGHRSSPTSFREVGDGAVCAGDSSRVPHEGPRQGIAQATREGQGRGPLRARKQQQWCFAGCGCEDPGSFQHHRDLEGGDGGHEGRAHAEEECQGRGVRGDDGWLLLEGDFSGESQVSLECHEDAGALESSNLSASQKLSQQLSLSRARDLEQKSWALAPSIFQGLVAERRPVLMEVACSPESVLTKTVQQLTGDSEAAVRCSKWISCDLETAQGVRPVLQRLELERPTHCWLSPPCEPYSPLQNINARTEEQREQQTTSRANLRWDMRHLPCVCSEGDTCHTRVIGKMLGMEAATVCATTAEVWPL